MLDLFHANGAKRARDDVSWILIRQGFAVMLHPLLHLAEDKLNRVVIRRVWWQKNHSYQASRIHGALLQSEQRYSAHEPQYRGPVSYHKTPETP